MKIFLDTSSLFKLYHKENDTETIERIFSINEITDVFLSEIALIEFTSTVWKKVRTLQLNELEAQKILARFETDLYKYNFIQIDSIITEEARNLITKYGKQGLRTLDSIQLSTAVMLQYQSNLFVTSDKLLNSFFKQESLVTEL
jgi:predicted nucleic acid-binding protein